MNPSVLPNVLTDELVHNRNNESLASHQSIISGNVIPQKVIQRVEGNIGLQPPIQFCYRGWFSSLGAPLEDAIRLREGLCFGDDMFHMDCVESGFELQLLVSERDTDCSLLTCSSRFVQFPDVNYLGMLHTVIPLQTATRNTILCEVAKRVLPWLREVASKVRLLLLL